MELDNFPLSFYDLIICTIVKLNVVVKRLLVDCSKAFNDTQLDYELHLRNCLLFLNRAVCVVPGGGNNPRVCGMETFHFDISQKVHRNDIISDSELNKVPN